MKLRFPRVALLITWVAFTALSYYVLIFTWWGNYFHGGGPVDRALLDGFVVLATFCSLEVFRTETLITLRVASALLGAPLALFAGLSLWYGLKPYVAA